MNNVSTRQTSAAVEGFGGDARAGDRFAECRWSNAWLVGSSKSGLWHGALDGIIRGHLIAFHGGDLPGFHSQISFMPNEHIGVIVFVIGNHTRRFTTRSVTTFMKRLLGMDQTPWTDIAARHPFEEQESGHGSAQQGRLWARAGYEAVASSH